jgi:hypothetical protein
MVTFAQYLADIPAQNPGVHKRESTFVPPGAVSATRAASGRPAIPPEPTTPLAVTDVLVALDMSGSTRFSAWGGRGARGGRGGPAVTKSVESDSPESNLPEPKTPHIALAEVEALARVLSVAKQYLAADTRVNVVGFSDTLQPWLLPSDTPLGAVDIANLPHLLPYPAFGGTLLAPAITSLARCTDRCIDQHTSTPGRTVLLVVVTDGVTTDPPATAEALNMLEKSCTALHCVVVGAGSIGTNPAAPRGTPADVSVLQSRQSRGAAFAGSGSYGAECNIQYLESLAGFHTIGAAGCYAGAFGDYAEVETRTRAALLGQADTTERVWVESDTTGFHWQARPHQVEFVRQFLRSNVQDGEAFSVSVASQDGRGPSFDATMVRRGGTLEVTDEFGHTRAYVVARACDVEERRHVDDFGLVRLNIATAHQD